MSALGGYRDERGTTVAEVSIVTALLSLVLSGAMGVLISLQNASQGTTERGVNLSEGRLLMQQSTKDLRTATRLTSGTSPFVKATPTDVTFYANINVATGPNKVRLYTDANSRLVEEVIPPDATSIPPAYTYNATPPKIRFVGQYLNNGPDKPPFVYYGEDGGLLAMDPVCSCLNDEGRLSVRAVGVTFSIRHTTSLEVAPTTLVNRVRLPNLDYNEESPG